MQIVNAMKNKQTNMTNHYSDIRVYTKVIKPRECPVCKQGITSLN
jgi:hypothetical protein